jgi:hypothetical protein
LASRLPSSSDEPQASGNVGFGRHLEQASRPKRFLNRLDSRCLTRAPERAPRDSWPRPALQSPAPSRVARFRAPNPSLLPPTGDRFEGLPEVAPRSCCSRKSQCAGNLGFLAAVSTSGLFGDPQSDSGRSGSRSGPGPTCWDSTRPPRRPTGKRPGPFAPSGARIRGHQSGPPRPDAADSTLRGPPLTGMPLSSPWRRTPRSFESRSSLGSTEFRKEPGPSRAWRTFRLTPFGR